MENSDQTTTISVAKLTKRKSQELNRFIDRSKAMFPDKFTYALVIYKNTNIKVTLIYQLHGEFDVMPCSHFVNKYGGCEDCRRSSVCLEFITNSKKIHGEKYDYSKVNYIRSNVLVTIICPIHGEYDQLPQSHVKGHGCRPCSGEKLRLEQAK
jgi:hypothetical protein